MLIIFKINIDIVFCQYEKRYIYSQHLSLSYERPELAATISPEDMEKYDVIFLGYPNWWGTIPMAMFTFLEQYDLSGKTIVPFCTHGGGGLGRGVDDITRISPNATILQGFAVNGGSVSRAQNDVADWLRGLGYIR